MHRPFTAAVCGVLGVLIGAAPARAAGGPIDALVQLVDRDTLDASVAHLSGYETRRADTPQARLAAEWLAAGFRACGADSVTLQNWSHGYAPNVVAVRRGVTRPHEVVIVGGHFDSVTRAGQGAPGADDNASGTACVLECARALCTTRFERTLQFAAFSAEELGLFGSNAYLANLVRGDDSLVAMINVDMIGFRSGGDIRDLDIVSDAASGWLRDAAFAAAALHVTELPLVDGAYPNGATSDVATFWSVGCPAIAFFEDSGTSSPFIHTSQDVIGASYNDDVLASLSTRVAVALLATLASPVAVPVVVQDLQARGDADGVEISWRLEPGALAGLAGVDVERAPEALGPWMRRTVAPLPPRANMRWSDEEPSLDARTWYRLSVRALSGERTLVGPIEVRAQTMRTALLAAREIPGGDAIEIRWSLGPEATNARLAVYDAGGREVRGLGSGTRPPGAYLQTWDGRDARGTRVARGVYLVHLDAGAARVSRKLLLLRP